MVNSNVPRYSNLASELHRNYFFKFKLVLSSFRSNTHMMAPLCEQITNCSVSTPAANMVKLYSFNPLWTMITTMFREKSNMYHISEPIIRRFFSQSCATSFTFEQFSLIHSAFQWNAATLCKVLAPFSFSHVIDSCSLFIFFFIFLFLSWFFLTKIVVKFLIKQLFYLGLLDIKWL